MAKPPKGHIPFWRLHRSNFKKCLLSIIYSINIIHAAGIVRRNRILSRISITGFFGNISKAGPHVKYIFPTAGRSAFCTGFNGSAASRYRTGNADTCRFG